MITRILGIWTKVETFLIGVMIFASLGCFLGGAVLRAVAPAHSVDYAEEIAIYLIIWATMISGSVLAAQGRHINTEIFTMGLPMHIRRAVNLAILGLTLAFCVAMFVYGKQAFEFALLLDERSASTLRVPQAYAVFLALPVGMALIIGRIVLMALDRQISISEGTVMPSKKDNE